MKIQHLLIAAIPALALPCSAAISISIQAGELLNSSSNMVTETSLWAIIYDANGDNMLPGGLELNSSLTTGDTTTIIAAFAGKQITTGATIGLDKILWAGEVDGLNTSGASGIGGHNLSSFTFASLGVAAGGKWAVYWFPSLTAGSNTLPGSSFEVGGIQQTTVGLSGGDIGMVMPAADNTGSTYSAAFIDIGNGGDIADSSLTAVAIPEPSTLVLSALGLAALLRRRRN